MPLNERVILQHASALGTNVVLRNTYLLLSLTLLFSTATAALGMLNPPGFGASIVVFIGSFALLFATSALRNSGWGIVSVFGFTGLMGYSLGPLLNAFIHNYTNGAQLIMTALGGTGITFLGLSAYTIATKKEMSAWGKTLMIGLVICIVASLANIFLKMPAVQMAVSALMIFISSMLIMVDTSRIIHNGEQNYIMATISLYLDILMLFQNLLMLLSMFGDRR
jgi:modulator of FtsH protease